MAHLEIADLLLLLLLLLLLFRLLLLLLAPSSLIYFTLATCNLWREAYECIHVVNPLEEARHTPGSMKGIWRII